MLAEYAFTSTDGIRSPYLISKIRWLIGSVRYETKKTLERQDLTIVVSKALYDILLLDANNLSLDIEWTGYDKSDMVSSLHFEGIEVIPGSQVNERGYIRIYSNDEPIPRLNENMRRPYGGSVHRNSERYWYLGRADAKVPSMTIKKVIFNDPATIILWEDGTKTVVKAQNGKDEFDPEKGLVMAIVKKMLGNSGNYYNTVRKALNGAQYHRDKETRDSKDTLFDTLEELGNRLKGV